MRLLMILLGVSLLWIILAQSCMTMRTSDSNAIKDFDKKNVALRTYDFKTGGRNIHYVATGSDTMPTLVFIHGSPGSWDAFAGYLQDSTLLQHYRMISIDRPGFGYSDYGDAMSMNAQMPLLSDVLKHVANGKPLCLIGHSLGGPIIVKLAAENPEMPITNLVILAGSVDPSEEKPENWRSTLDHTALRWLVPGALRPSNAELLMFKKDVDDLADDFPKVKCHVLIMHGDKDDFVPPGNAVYSQNHLVNAKSVKLVWFEGERHFIPWTKFNDIRDALLNMKME